MNDFLKEQYEQARNTYLKELAYLNERNDQFAEQNGGVDHLDESKRKIYEARRLSIIKLVAFHDRAQEYLEDIENWIAELILEKKSAINDLTNAKEGWVQYFPRLTVLNESQKEHHRQMSITSLQMSNPELF